jgi:hypothetical protein
MLKSVFCSLRELTSLSLHIEKDFQNQYVEPCILGGEITYFWLESQWPLLNFFEIVVGGPPVLGVDVFGMLTDDRKLHGMIFRGDSLLLDATEGKGNPIDDRFRTWKRAGDH